MWIRTRSFRLASSSGPRQRDSRTSSSTRCAAIPTERCATSFGDIFTDNARKNGLLPVVLAAQQVATLMNVARIEKFEAAYQSRYPWRRIKVP